MAKRERSRGSDISRAAIQQGGRFRVSSLDTDRRQMFCVRVRI
ncbi:MAG: hypothetical protein RIT02_1157 [Planctomycetota bacterium]